MKRLTKLEIQRALLAGEPVSWTDSSSKTAVLRLSEPSQRRLFACLLASDVREPKELPIDFISSLAAALIAEHDPASGSGEAAHASAASGPWRLKRIETEGFGGLNTYGGPAFFLDLDAESFLLQGPNGSGKSSLIGAVLWAMTGERPRDQSDARPETRADVQNEECRSVGTWPPIACYPSEPGRLIEEPHVRVTLTFIEPAGTLAKVERILKDGVTIRTQDATFEAPDILVETGLLMPSRMSQIRLQKGETRLTEAVQMLTGLDDLLAIGQLADGLCHKGREYLSTNAKEFRHHQELFETALAEARSALESTGVTVPAFEPHDTQDKDGAMAALGKQLNQRAAELTQVVADDLVSGLDLKSPKVQLDLAGAISGAREDLASGLEALPAWRELSRIEAALPPEVASALARAAEVAEAELGEVLEVDRRSAIDSRLQLKALGAYWHENHRGGPVSQCPLCDQRLDGRPELRQELESLRKGGETVTRRLSDNLNAIRVGLDRSIPAVLERAVSEAQTWSPRKRLIENLEARFITPDRYSRHLAKFVALSRASLGELPEEDLPAGAPLIAVADGDFARVVSDRVAAVRRLLQMASWFHEVSERWRAWWKAISGQPSRGAAESLLAQANALSQDGPQEEDTTRETLAQHLDRLSAAIGEAAPYRLAAAALRRAWESGKQAWEFEREQKQRERITQSLAPLKNLGPLAHSQARSAIESLSDEIGAILNRIQIIERLSFRSAHLEKKAGLTVRAGFGPKLSIDATLVANTSWLRAILWAFLLAMRKEAVKQLGADPFPILLLDDPQATFDSENRHRWVREIVGLQQEEPLAQIVLTTCDEAFLELVKIDGLAGREALIASAGPELGRVGIFEGASLERMWAECQKQRSNSAGRMYMIQTRIYLEGMLRLMLRGESSDLSTVGDGFVIGKSRELLEQLGRKGIAPWNKAELNALVKLLSKGRAEIKYVEMAHHPDGAHLGMGEATAVEFYRRKKLQPALHGAFRLVRDHRLLHGGLKALHAAEPTCTLPEGYQARVAALRLGVLGRAAALSNGRAADGRVELTLGAPSEVIKLGRHFAFRLAESTMEPVARRGDVLLVQEFGEPTPRSLVVARFEDRLLARRFEISENHTDVAALTAQAVNPRQILAPIVVKRATLGMQKIIGVLFDNAWTPLAQDNNEICDCGGESAISHLTSALQGLVEVEGQSAEPIALDGQFLLIGAPVSAHEALTNLEGRPVIARDGDDNRYFKRLRQGGRSHVVLESLEIGGDFSPVLLTHDIGGSTDLAQVWPVLGVLFERPR